MNRIVGLKWHRERPSVVTAGELRKRLGASGPAVPRYDGDIRLLPGDFVAFGHDLYSLSTGKGRGAYRQGSATWTDAFFGATASHSGNRRTRLAPGKDGRWTAVYCLSDNSRSAQLGVALVDGDQLRGRSIDDLDVFVGKDGGVPFEFVPHGTSGRAHLLTISPRRVPVLLDLTPDGVAEVSRGEALPEGVIVGSPAWCDCNGDGRREYIAPGFGPDHQFGAWVLLAEPSK